MLSGRVTSPSFPVAGCRPGLKPSDDASPGGSGGSSQNRNSGDIPSRSGPPGHSSRRAARHVRSDCLPGGSQEHRRTESCARSRGRSPRPHRIPRTAWVRSLPVGHSRVGQGSLASRTETSRRTNGLGSLAGQRKWNPAPERVSFPRRVLSKDELARGAEYFGPASTLEEAGR